MAARLMVPRPMAGWQGLVLGRAEDGWLVDQVRLKLEPEQRKTSGAQFGTVNGFISPKTTAKFFMVIPFCMNEDVGQMIE